jgi:hypothetical protein
MIPTQGDLRMKGIIFGVAIAVGAVLSVTSPNAQASCASICAHEYDLCIEDGRTAAQCRTEQQTCLADCLGSSVTTQHRQTNIKDQKGQQIVLGQSRPASLIPLKADS